VGARREEAGPLARLPTLVSSATAAWSHFHLSGLRVEGEWMTMSGTFISRLDRYDYLLNQECRKVKCQMS
jgi:hypothetical protein